MNEVVGIHICFCYTSPISMKATTTPHKRTTNPALMLCWRSSLYWDTHITLINGLYCGLDVRFVVLFECVFYVVGCELYSSTHFPVRLAWSHCDWEKHRFLYFQSSSPRFHYITKLCPGKLFRTFAMLKNWVTTCTYIFERHTYCHRELRRQQCEIYISYTYKYIYFLDKLRTIMVTKPNKYI